MDVNPANRLRDARRAQVAARQQRHQLAERLRRVTAQVEDLDVSRLHQSNWVSWEEADAIMRRDVAAEEEFVLARMAAMRDEGPPIINSALSELASLVGEWDVEIDPNRDGENGQMGIVTFEWLAGRAQLLMRTHVPNGWKGLTANVATISRDTVNRHYTVQYVDDRGASETYTMQFGNGIWKQERVAPELSRRFIGTLAQDGNKIEGKWQKAKDRRKWQDDYTVIYWRHIERQ